MFECFYFSLDAEQVVDIVIPIAQAGFFIIIDLECFLIACGGQGDGLVLKVDFDGCGWIFFDGGEDLCQEILTDGHRQQEVVQGVVLKDICEEAADDDVEAGVFDCPGGVFTAGAAAEVLACHEDLSFVGRVVQYKVFFGLPVAFIAPVAEEVLSESVAAGGFQEAGGDDLIGIYVLPIEGDGGRSDLID